MTVEPVDLRERVATGVPAIAVAGLRKRFGDVAAVSDVSFEVGGGEVVGLLGPNGAGKTTTVSCIAGLVRPDAGHTAILGVRGRPGTRSRLPFCLSTQRLGVYPLLTVDANLRFFAALAGVDRREVDGAVREVVDRFELGGVLRTQVSRLSIGQQRLVHVGTAFVGRPDVLVLDEPTAGLDVTARALVLAAVRAEVTRGTTVVYSSHYLAEVEELCERVVILAGGRVIADGRVDDLVATHGGGRVEVELADGVIVHDGTDVRGALGRAGSLHDIRGLKVVPPSLEAVFLALTGGRIDEKGEAVC